MKSIFYSYFAHNFEYLLIWGGLQHLGFCILQPLTTSNRREMRMSSFSSGENWKGDSGDKCNGCCPWSTAAFKMIFWSLALFALQWTSPSLDDTNLFGSQEDKVEDINQHAPTSSVGGWNEKNAGLSMRRPKDYQENALQWEVTKQECRFNRFPYKNLFKRLTDSKS